MVLLCLTMINSFAGKILPSAENILSCVAGFTIYCRAQSSHASRANLFDAVMNMTSTKNLPSLSFFTASNPEIPGRFMSVRIISGL